MKLIYLYMEPFAPGCGPYVHATGIIEGLKKKVEVLFFKPNYNKNKKLPGSFGRFLMIVCVQIRALCSLHRVRHVYIRLHFMGILFFIFAFILKKKIIVEANGPVTDAFFHWKSFFLIRKIVCFFFKLQLKLSDAIIVVTPQLKDYFSQYYCIEPVKIHVVANAATFPAFSDREDNRRKKNQNGAYILYAGSLTKWQGLEFLLEAVMLDAWPKNLSLYICGKGLLSLLVKEYALRSSKIKYCGFVEPEDLHDYYHNCVLSIIPKNNLFNRCETGLSPIKFYETLAYGVPTIVTDIPPISNIVRQYDLGLVVPYSCSASLAEAVKKLYEDVELREKQSKNAINFIMAGNTWRDRAEQTLEIIENL